MAVVLIILLLFVGSRAESNNKTTCNGFQANFDVNSIIGKWYVVAIIPEKLFPDNQKHISCYEVEFSETDEAGLRWLVNNSVQTTRKSVTKTVGIMGTIIRQRYFSEQPFDVWSKNVSKVEGCFQQVLILDANNKRRSEISQAVIHDATMQLHLLDTIDKNGPFLLQILWGNMISAVIYRRKEGVTQEQLKPAFEFMNKLRGPQRIPRICEKTLKDTTSPHLFEHF